jgi:solute carrier family 25 phosphate transporter 23/24/25/41
MDQDNSLQISFDEWRSFFMVNPAILESVINDPHEMLRYWRSALVDYSSFLENTYCLLFDQYLDLGDSPYGTHEDALTEGSQWWKNLVAGGVAGAVSRTATAPFDRLKIIMQVDSLYHRCFLHFLAIHNDFKRLINIVRFLSIWVQDIVCL